MVCVRCSPFTHLLFVQCKQNQILSIESHTVIILLSQLQNRYHPWNQHGTSKICHPKQESHLPTIQFSGVNTRFNAVSGRVNIILSTLGHRFSGGSPRKKNLHLPRWGVPCSVDKPDEDRFISKMFLRGDSVILVLRNPKSLGNGGWKGGGNGVFLVNWLYRSPIERGNLWSHLGKVGNAWTQNSVLGRDIGYCSQEGKVVKLQEA